MSAATMTAEIAAIEAIAVNAGSATVANAVSGSATAVTKGQNGSATTTRSPGAFNATTMTAINAVAETGKAEGAVAMAIVVAVK